VTIFLMLVAFGLLANLYILYSVSRECRKLRRKAEVLERISPESSTKTYQHRNLYLVRHPERSA
jgi:hypothetical protein